MAPFRSVSLVMAASVMAVMLKTCTEAAPAERGILVKPPPFLSVQENRDSPNVAAVQEKTESPANNQRRFLGSWIPTEVAGLTRGTGKSRAKATATAKAAANSGLVRVPRSSPETAGPDKSTQILKMISALEELYRTINGTLSKRITFMPRANSRNSAKKNKVVASVAGSKVSTVPPMETGGTVSRPSTDNVLPSLSGRNFKKSIPPQPKKSNKRVCFWKYCSQN